MAAAASLTVPQRTPEAVRAINPILALRLVGLTDGEGCFSIRHQTGGGYRCEFIIKLREDDRPLLERFREGCGGIGLLRRQERTNGWAPTVSWIVSKKVDVVLIRDLFAAYPLWSKKRRDAELWSAAVDAWTTIYTHERTDWSEIADIARRLKQTRTFVAPSPLPDKPHGERRGGQR